jgi:4-amino-4-deoxy-L-arabinose transferase-like glycosyltransferase
VALLSAFFFQSYLSLSSQSATFDEVQYFGIGKYLLTTHKWDVMGAILHPPLPYYLNSIPLLFVEQPSHVWGYDPGIIRDRAFLGAVDFYRGQALLSDRSNHDDRLLIASRLMTAFISLLLGWYVYRFSSELNGVNGGILSAILFAFNPSMLAFSGLIVPDMPLTVFGFIALYYLWRFLKTENLRSLLIGGILLGCALLSKFTALLLVPLVVSSFLTIMYLQKRKLALRLVLVLAVAALVLFVGYWFDLRPYFEGIIFQMDKNQTGQATFLMGQHSAHGWWYFYPLAFLIKTPIAVTVLFVSAIVLMIIRKRLFKFDTLYLLAPILLILLFFTLSNGAIGVRYLLPVYPFMFVVIGSLGTQGKVIRGVAYGLSVWCIVAALSVSPHYLAYFNEAVGGPAQGYHYLVDSNLDWGQDLIGLKKFMDINGIKRVSLSYFGADAPQRYGISYDWLPSHYLYNPEPEKRELIPPGQLVAISATNLQGVYLDSPQEYVWLTSYEPVAKIGYSIFVYDLQGGRKFKQ